MTAVHWIGNSCKGLNRGNLSSRDSRAHGIAAALSHRPLRRAPTTDTWGYGNQAPATCFPTASALSASWDMDLLEEVGAALGVESNALGVDLL